jgi:hypothetical protein
MAATAQAAIAKRLREITRLLSRFELIYPRSFAVRPDTQKCVARPLYPAALGDVAVPTCGLGCLAEEMAAPAISERPDGARWGREVTTIGHALREFVRRGSPWAIGTGILVLVGVRVAVADLNWRDAVAVAAMLGIYPFGEWAIHVYLLHARPLTIRGREVETVAARAHRAHHGQPNDLDLILLYWWQAGFLMLVAVPFTVALGATAVTLTAGPVPLGALISAALAGYCMVFVYEWTHFLIHTAYRPRSRAYKTVWRNHRLHHFKNEHFWHGITNNLSDRVLGTNPDQRGVPKSDTARTLDPGR